MEAVSEKAKVEMVEEGKEGASPTINGICMQPKQPGPCEALIRRWYLNVDINKCELFSYGGCRGNQNNFRSEKECQDKCFAESETATPLVVVEVCKTGSALLDRSGANEACRADGSCPRGYRCQSGRLGGICCTDKAVVADRINLPRPVAAVLLPRDVLLSDSD
ncbi:PREDICTED: chelonianin-like, partial [Priapulus caudatus]|uniref:Chelonianin-like n=1 Tax=Priapulus caudatus TaxID=37621 RepID=A0ABM1EQW2_PRICU